LSNAKGTAAGVALARIYRRLRALPSRSQAAALWSAGHLARRDFDALYRDAAELCRMLGQPFDETSYCKPRILTWATTSSPASTTGTYILDMRTNTFVLREGPVFTNVLLGDEINRAPAKTQSALLEAMQEQQVTIEGETRSLGEPFIVLATQNPIEQEGTYP